MTNHEQQLINRFLDSLNIRCEVLAIADELQHDPDYNENEAISELIELLQVKTFI